MKKTPNLIKIALLMLLAGFSSGSWAYTQNVGIGQVAPVSKLDINGGLTVGTTYSGTNVAPANGAIIQGDLGGDRCTRSSTPRCGGCAFRR